MSGAEIRVRREGDHFAVHVTEGGSTTEHAVTVCDEDLSSLGSGYGSPEEFVRASFEFLLAKEPKEQILRRFDIGVISTYFPEYEREIAR